MKTIAPPDPNTRTPTYTVPPNSCDTHCHVFGPGDIFPFADARKYTPPDSPKEELRKLHDVLGIDRAVIVQASCHGTDNRAMLDAIRNSDGRYRGVCNASEEFSADYFRELHDGGIRGVRFNFVKHLGGAPNLDEMWTIIDRVGELPWHVELHFDAKDLLEFESVIDAIPLPVVIDHMGRAPVHEPSIWHRLAAAELTFLSPRRDRQFIHQGNPPNGPPARGRSAPGSSNGGCRAFRVS